MTARDRRPGLGRQAVSASWSLRALLTVALANLALRSQPVFGFVAWFKSAPLREQVGEAADFLLHIDGNEIGARFASSRFPAFCGLSGFRLLGFRYGCGRGAFSDSPTLVGLRVRVPRDTAWTTARCLG